MLYNLKYRELKPTFKNQVYETEISEKENLENFYLGNLNQENPDLGKLNLKNSDLKNLNLQNVDLESLDLQNLNLENVDLEGSDLENLYLENADLEGSDLENLYLENADLESSDLENLNLENVDLENLNPLEYPALDRILPNQPDFKEDLKDLKLSDFFNFNQMVSFYFFQLYKYKYIRV